MPHTEIFVRSSMCQRTAGSEWLLYWEPETRATGWRTYFTVAAAAYSCVRNWKGRLRSLLGH